ncbi:MAG: alpha/beta hydrolase [Ignavibacteriaceae bacterium]
MQFRELEYPLPYKTILLKNGYSIAYLDEGESDKTLLLVHGLGTYSLSWIHNIEELKKHFRCIAVDLPGYGKSSAGIHPGTMNFYSDILSDFIEALQLKNISLAGHSMGGQISITFALLYPSVVKTLFLLAPAGIEIFTGSEELLIKKNFTADTYFMNDEEKIRSSFTGNFYNMPAGAEFMIRDRIIMKESKNFYDHCRVVANSLYGMLDEPVSGKLQELACPVYIIWGENDKLIPNPYFHPEKTPSEIAESAASVIPDAKLFMIKECGHFIPFEKPLEVNSIIKSAFII